MGLMKDTGDPLKYKTSTKSKIIRIALAVGYFVISYQLFKSVQSILLQNQLWEHSDPLAAVGLFVIYCVVLMIEVLIEFSRLLIVSYLLPINTRLVVWVQVVLITALLLWVQFLYIYTGTYDFYVLSWVVRDIASMVLAVATLYKKPPYRFLLKVLPIHLILDTLLNHTSIAPHLPKEVSRKISEMKQRVREEELAFGIRLPENSPTQWDAAVALVEHNTDDEDADKAERLENAYQELLTDREHDPDTSPLPSEQSSVTVESTEDLLAPRCLTCGHANPVSDKFCGECGEVLHILCPSCRTDNPPENQFCGQCGTNLKSD